MWPTQPPSFPLFPGRAVSVLNGTWDFAFLGERGALEARIPDDATFVQRIAVPDAFDARPHQPRCSACWPATGDGAAAAEASEALCWRCCSRALGAYGDPECWWDPEGPLASRSFSECCGRDPLRLRRGVAAYRAEVAATATAAVLTFGGCAFRCLVAVDGVFLADHAGLSPFTVDVPAPRDDRGMRTVVVLVDNRFNRRTHPVHQRHYDWYQAGGILRAVQFHALPTRAALYLAGVEVYPKSLVEVGVLVRLSPPATGRVDLLYRFRFDDTEPGCSDLDGWGFLEPSEGLRQLSVPGARPWSTADPNLHRLKVAMVHEDGDEHLLDCVEVRFGLRTVATRGQEILLNGEPLKLYGFNRHDMTDTPVMTHAELVQDIAVLQALGANFVRGAHYAQDQRFLDLCDVHGLLVWEEVLGWQNSVHDFEDGIFMSQALRLADEMAAASANHPSVIFFGFFNEGESSDGGPVAAAAFETFATRLRRRSLGTRLVSWGSSAGMDDKHLAHADVCAFHLYPAWYPTRKPASMEEVQEIPLLWEAMASWVREHHPDKPLLVTEAGAGALLGHRGASDVKWTEEYQSLLLQMHFLAIMRNPSIAGIAFWQFADMPVDQNTSGEEHRPRGLNNKGVVGLDRSPKVAFQALRLLRHQKPGGYFGLILPPEDAPRLAGKLKI